MLGCRRCALRSSCQWLGFPSALSSVGGCLIAAFSTTPVCLIREELAKGHIYLSHRFSNAHSLLSPRLIVVVKGSTQDVRGQAPAPGPAAVVSAGARWGAAWCTCAALAGRVRPAVAAVPARRPADVAHVPSSGGPPSCPQPVGCRLAARADGVRFPCYLRSGAPAGWLSCWRCGLLPRDSQWSSITGRLSGEAVVLPVSAWWAHCPGLAGPARRAAFLSDHAPSGHASGSAVLGRSSCSSGEDRLRPRLLCSGGRLGASPGGISCRAGMGQLEKEPGLESESRCGGCAGAAEDLRAACMRRRGDGAGAGRPVRLRLSRPAASSCLRPSVIVAWLEWVAVGL